MRPQLRFETKKIRAAALGPQSSVPDLLGESILQNNLKFELDETDEIYEGYGRRPNAYPYRQYNGYTRELEEREVKAIVLENDYLKALFLPEYGGRLWELWDKESGRNLLYTNDVLQFSNLAVRNAWFSGGVEWNIGIIGHSPLTTECLYTAKTQDEEGNPILRMYEYERIREVTYQMDFWMKEDDRVLNCRMRVVNEGSEVIPMYWWSNIAVPEYEGGRVIVPADEAFTNGDGMVYKVDIPMVNGIDVTDYQKIGKSVDYFFDIPEGNPKYIANVDRTGYGLLHLSTQKLRSRKLFSWGSLDASDRWQEFLTDKAGRYIEIQAGLGKTQYGCIPMAPHTSWEWMEQYGAVQVPTEVLKEEHQKRAEFLTEQINEKKRWENLEAELKNTKKMALEKAELVLTGSGYGALTEERKFTKHLEFCLETESLKKWKQFFETGVLHCPNPMEAPDEFMINEKSMDSLKERLEKGNEENWYAHYQLGLGYFTQKKYEPAKEELRKSLALAENPWSLHALGCTCFVLNEKDAAADYILKGIEKERENISYLKEGLKLLSLCGKYQTVCSVYEALGEREQKTAKIKFYYISALHKLGENEKAYQLLEENGGLVMEDIREGEDSIAPVWEELYQSLYGEKKEIPHIYNFGAF